jgi:hypothetical protein
MSKRYRIYWVCWNGIVRRDVMSKRYRIYWVCWNGMRRQYLGSVFANSEPTARIKARQIWPCGNGQEYVAEQVTR